MSKTEIKACTKTVKNFHDPYTFSYNKKILATKNLYYLYISLLKNVLRKMLLHIHIFTAQKLNI